MSHNKIFSFVWKMLERISTQLVQFSVQIILARLLMPEDYGVVAIVMILISFASVFVQAGFNSALIQKKNATAVDFSSVLFLNIFMAFFLYIILFFSAGIIAEFYKQPILIPVIRVFSITLFFSAFNSVQYAYLSKNLQFKKSFYSYLVSVTIAGSVGVTFAYLGFGVWALVFYQLLNNFTLCIIMWFTVKWRPKKLFSFQSIQTLFSYGSKIFIAHLIDTMYKEIQYILLGKITTAEMMGYYSRGLQFPNMFVRNINDTIKTVLLPLYSEEQDDILRIKKMLRTSIRTIVFFVFPMMSGMAMVADPLVRLLLTDKWLQSVPFIQIFCASYAFSSLMSANGQAINSIGRSDIYLRIIIRKVIFIAISMLVASNFGIYAIAFSTLFTDLYGITLTFKVNKKLFNYTKIEMLQDVFPSLLLALFMGVIVHFVSIFNQDILPKLITQILLGVVVYLGLARIMNLEGYKFLKTILNELKGKNSNEKVEKL